MKDTLLPNLTLPLFLILIVFSTYSCIDCYSSKIQKWQRQRLADLKDPYGWSSVVGLYPIQDSVTTFGSNEDNYIIIENGPPQFGYVRLVKGGVAFSSDNLKDEQPKLLRTDIHPDGPTYGRQNSIQWHVIEREGDYFLRVKDTLSSYRKALTSIPTYPINKMYLLIGKIDESISPNAQITYKNILGMDITNKIAAVIKFQWKGNEYSLTGTDAGDGTYMVMVHDKTTGIDTYGGGRYLYPNAANEDGVVILDFNKLENPPCVFTPYATCPLPPKSNHLPFKIEAGEQMLHLY